MEESVDLHEEAGKENEQTLANLSPAEEASSKDEVEIGKFFCRSRNKKTAHFHSKARQLSTTVKWSMTLV